MLSRLACALLLLGATVAGANDRSDAERLYDEGHALAEAGKPLEACAKFEQSLAKDPRQVGVLMNLALCSERSGKIATALALYQEAFDRASEAGLAGTRDKASSEIARLMANVPQLMIAHAAPPLPGERLVIDDAVIANDRTTLSLDPGRHAVVVTAPGRLPFETTIKLDLGGRTKLVVPVLEAPRATVVVAPSARRPIGKVMMAGGASALAVAVGLAIYAHHDYRGLFGGSTPHCGVHPSVNGEPVCDAFGVAQADHDRRLANGSLITGAVGIAIALAGVALWWPASSDPHVAPMATASGGGLSVVGSF